MPFSNWISLAGLVLDIIGVAALLSNEILTRIVGVAESKMPNTVALFEDSLTDAPKGLDPQVVGELERASNAISPGKALMFARVGAALIILGFALQAVGVVVSGVAEPVPRALWSADR